MKSMLGVIVLLAVLAVVGQGAVAATPDDFIGTWNGTQRYTGFANAWDLEITLEIGCVGGQLMVHGDVRNTHQNPNVPSNLHLDGDASEIIKKGKDLIILIPYYLATKPVEKRVNSQNVMQYILTFGSDGAIEGPALQTSTTHGKQFYAKLNRTSGSAACVGTPPSVG